MLTGKEEDSKGFRPMETILSLPKKDRLLETKMPASLHITGVSYPTRLLARGRPATQLVIKY